MKEFTLQKYRDLGEILTDTFQYIRIHWKSLGKALLLLVLPFYLVSGFLVGDAYSSLFSALMQNPDTAGDAFIGGGFFIGMLLLAMSSVALLTVALTHIQLTREYGEVELAQITERFGSNFIRLFLLYLIIVIAISFSFFLFIIPAIYIGIKLVPAPAASIFENLNPIEAIQRSWTLVQGHWWFTFAVYVVMNIITSFMSYVLIIPMSFIIGLMSASGAASSDMVESGMGLIYSLMIVFASLFSVIILIATALHYFNLIERKEGRGLRAQIEELG